MIIHPDMAGALAKQHQHDLLTRAARRHSAPGGRSARQAAGLRVPRYRVSWSRTTLSPGGAGAAGGRGRSWVIVISATRGL